MTIINENLAQRAKENMSFTDYKPGSATAEYNAATADVAAKIEAAKANVSDEAKARLDRLFSWYCSSYAAWINKYNQNGANHVSVMVAGPSNYNMNRHNKYLEREAKLWAEYDELKDITYKIRSIVDGDKIIKSGDADAIPKLQEKLAKALQEHEAYKTHNAKARKEGKEPLPAYVLQNSNGRIKAIRDRIAKLERIKAQVPTETAAQNGSGIRVVDNTEACRVQIFFPDKPDADIRNNLKKHGFKWAPSIGAWQNYRNPRNLEFAASLQ